MKTTNENKNYWVNLLDSYKQIKEIVKNGEYDENSLIKWSPNNYISFGINFYKNKNNEWLLEFIPKFELGGRIYYFEDFLSEDIIYKCDYEIGMIETLLKREYSV